jgi:transcriptional regulator with XRE-family HTH domain
MKERILEFLKKENKSSAQLADEIGVQASGISHILSGRNNPSLDFVLKMLEKYQFLSSDWLLFGKGSIYKEAKMQNLFDYDATNSIEKPEIQTRSEKIRPEVEFQNQITPQMTNDSGTFASKSASEVVKIVWFYENNSFEEFFPRR